MSALDLGGWDVIENEVDASLCAFVHHTVPLLIVDLVDVSDLHFLRTTINHEPHPGIGVNGYMDPMPVVERRVFVVVGLDDPAGL